MGRPGPSALEPGRSHRIGRMPPEPLLEVRDLSIHLLSHRAILSGVSFDIPTATIAGLSGDSGAGVLSRGVRECVQGRYSAVAGSDGPDPYHHHTRWSVFWTSHRAGRRTRTGHLAPLPLIADPDSVAGLKRDDRSSADCRVRRSGSNRHRPGYLRHTFSHSPRGGGAGISLCDRRLSWNRFVDRGAG